jgi:hypothetical protein
MAGGREHFQGQVTPLDRVRDGRPQLGGSACTDSTVARPHATQRTSRACGIAALVNAACRDNPGALLTRDGRDFVEIAS